MKWIYLGEYGLWGLRLGGDVSTLHVSHLAKRKRKWLFCVKNGEWCDRNWCIRLHFCEFLTWKKENGGVIRPCKCISQFHLRPAPPRATAGHLPALSVPGVGQLQILHCPEAGHLPTPGPFPSFWHACSFLSEYNYTEGFTGKKADWHISQR